MWLQAVRAWDRDDSGDLSETMAALDKALDRAERVERLLRRPLFGGSAPPTEPELIDDTLTLDPEPSAPGPAAPEPVAPEPPAPEGGAAPGTVDPLA